MVKRRPSSGPAPVREWATFPDPGDPKRRWMVDVTWLTSPWRCLFGCGCQGVLTGPTPEMQQGCCSYGAHFSDEDDPEVPDPEEEPEVPEGEEEPEPFPPLTGAEPELSELAA